MAEELALHPVQAEVVQEVVPAKRAGRGRPPKGEVRPATVRYRVVGTIGEPDAERRRASLERQNGFVLITSAPAAELDGRARLEEYKGQLAVEFRFKFLHDPVFIDAIYVKKRDLVEALAYVFVIACLVFALLERQVRRALPARGEKLVVPGNPIVDRPTAKSLLEMLANVVVVRAGPGVRVLAAPAEIKRRAARMLELAGFDLAIYTQAPVLGAM